MQAGEALVPTQLPNRGLWSESRSVAQRLALSSKSSFRLEERVSHGLCLIPSMKEWVFEAQVFIDV